jgi:hypothetical protein
MPAYPVVAPINGINQGLFPFKVNKEFFREYVQITPYFNFMGNELTRPIVRHQMRAGEGFSYTVAKLNALDYTSPVYDFDQVSGAGQYQKADAMSVGTRAVSFSVIRKGMELIELGTPVDLPDVIRPQLIEACERNLNKDLIDAVTIKNYAVATQMPSYDRIVVAGQPGEVDARAAYNGRAGLLTVLNTCGDRTYAHSGPSTQHILKLKNYAIQGGATAEAEDMIKPAYILSKSGFPMNDYIWIVDSAIIAELYNDPTFFASTAARGTIIDGTQPQTINGADYHGRYFGVHIYESKDLAKYRQTSQDGTKVFAWNLFMGAGAISVGWYKEPWTAFMDNRIDMIQNFASHEIRGQSVLQFPAKLQSTLDAAAPVNKLVEQGIIHSLVRIS